MKHKAKSLVHRSSSISKHVPNGCPPPKMTSKSRSPTDVNVIPPVQAFVPLSPAIDEASAHFRRKDDDMVTVEPKIEQSYCEASIIVILWEKTEKEYWHLRLLVTVEV